MILIGIDPGTHTGVAVYNNLMKCLMRLETLKLHQALEFVEYVANQNDGKIEVYFEDARLRKWYGQAGREKLQGVGSVKRDCAIWEDFLTDKLIPFEAIPPRPGATKWTAEYFKRVTGYKGKCSDHARDAAMLVFGR